AERRKVGQANLGEDAQEEVQRAAAAARVLERRKGDVLGERCGIRRAALGREERGPVEVSALNPPPDEERARDRREADERQDNAPRLLERPSAVDQKRQQEGERERVREVVQRKRRQREQQAQQPARGAALDEEPAPDRQQRQHVEERERRVHPCIA